jgi:hypothetical protein
MSGENPHASRECLSRETLNLDFVSLMEEPDAVRYRHPPLGALIDEPRAICTISATSSNLRVTAAPTPSN